MSTGQHQRGSCSCPSAAGSPGGCSTGPSQGRGTDRGSAWAGGTDRDAAAVAGRSRWTGWERAAGGDRRASRAGAGRRRAVGGTDVRLDHRERCGSRTCGGDHRMTDVIVTRGLVKRFGRVTAVAGVDLRVPARYPVRPPGSQRLGQDDPRAHAARRRARHRGRGGTARRIDAAGRRGRTSRPRTSRAEPRLILGSWRS